MYRTKESSLSFQFPVTELKLSKVLLSQNIVDPIISPQPLYSWPKIAFFDLLYILQLDLQMAQNFFNKNTINPQNQKLHFLPKKQKIVSKTVKIVLKTSHNFQCLCFEVPALRSNLYNSQVAMSKGSKFILQLLTVLQKQQSQKQLQSESINNSSEQTLPADRKSKQIEKGVLVRKKEKNFYKRICQLRPTLEHSHIYKLYGFLGINEKAFQDADWPESLNYTHFQSRVIERVEAYDHALVFEFTQPTIPFNQPSIQYIIEKYKSKGDAKFYQLAQMIQELCQAMQLTQQKPHSSQKVQSVKKWLDVLGDQMYVCSMGSRKFVISKALLTYLEYDVDQFAVQAIKYRANFTELFSAINYGNLVLHLLKCLKYIAQFSLQQITLSEFRELTTYNYAGFIQSKNNARSFCDMTISMLNPSFHCHKINFIYYKEGAFSKRREVDVGLVAAIEDEKERIREGQYTTINKVKVVPRHLLRQNQKLFADYRTIEPKVQVLALDIQQA